MYQFLVRSVLFAGFCFALLTSAVQADCVVLLHGLNRTEVSMKTLQTELTESGYRVINHGYRSNKNTIPNLATELASSVTRCEGQRLNFVTHSLGGILVRAYLGSQKPRNLGRVVMLGPPNNGSEVVTVFGELGLFGLINGPAGLELHTGNDSAPNRLGPANFDLGIIAGNRALMPVFSGLLPKPNDGLVSVASTKLEGMNDHIVMPVDHTFMMRNDAVINQVKAFLKRGRFER